MEHYNKDVMFPLYLTIGVSPDGCLLVLCKRKKREKMEREKRKKERKKENEWKEWPPLTMCLIKTYLL